MSTKKTKLAGALAIVLIIGALCAGGGLFAANNTKTDSEQLNHKTGNHKRVGHKNRNHKNKQHKKANCKDSHNEKKDCSQEQCN